MSYETEFLAADQQSTAVLTSGINETVTLALDHL